MPISPDKQKQLANEQAGKNSSQEIKEKEKRQADSEQQVSQSLGMVNPNIRDAGGNVVLFEDENTGNGMNTPNQFITTKVTTPIYDEGSIDEVVDNVVDELIPRKKEEKAELTLAERIRNFFIEYEELRDPIWLSNEMNVQDSHVYLVKQSKTYLPIPKVSLRYDGDVVGTQGEGQLQSGNKIKLREAVFLPSMEGYTIDLYGLTRKENPVLTISDVIKNIMSTMGRLELGEIDARAVTGKLKRALNSKFDTGQIKFKELGELEEKIGEILTEIYPNLEQGEPKEDGKNRTDKSKPKQTTADKVKKKKKRRSSGFRRRRKDGRKYPNARNRIRWGGRKRSRTTNSRNRRRN